MGCSFHSHPILELQHQLHILASSSTVKAHRKSWYYIYCDERLLIWLVYWRSNHTSDQQMMVYIWTHQISKLGLKLLVKGCVTGAFLQHMVSSMHKLMLSQVSWCIILCREQPQQRCPLLWHAICLCSCHWCCLLYVTSRGLELPGIAKHLVFIHRSNFYLANLSALSSLAQCFTNIVPLCDIRFNRNLHPWFSLTWAYITDFSTIYSATRTHWAPPYSNLLQDMAVPMIHHCRMCQKWEGVNLHICSQCTKERKMHVLYSGETCQRANPGLAETQGRACRDTTLGHREQYPDLAIVPPLPGNVSWTSPFEALFHIQDCG